MPKQIIKGCKRFTTSGVISNITFDKNKNNEIETHFTLTDRTKSYKVLLNSHFTNKLKHKLKTGQRVFIEGEITLLKQIRVNKPEHRFGFL